MLIWLKSSPLQPTEAAKLAATGTIAGPVVNDAGLYQAGLYWYTAVSHEASLMVMVE